ncbi:TetR/AcrR family transcriptional regulator [Azospirillum thermophilum]|uniref:HTH tetR-type domain-containing protein n=1 Tax=Azospirillum thermophilum TaxID=2202148 RepID=A0A2S2CMG5_9PROT|nr:TetR/AcrR family transcriptional regulator [Azospirillum thermophilum]AWK85671.1 hypothetical protein DEW08_05390 [Azospirillum thermophilum]
MTSILPKRSPGRPPAVELESRNDHLLEAATAEFLEQGYGGASMARIARRAQASTKTIYARFAGKGDLLVAVVQRLVAASAAALEQSVADLDADPEEVLTAFALHAARHWVAPAEVGLYRLVVGESPRFPELVAIYRDGIGPYVALLEGYLEAQRRRGRLAVDDVALAARQFSRLTQSEVRERSLLGEALGEEALARIIRSGVRLFLHGCRGSR